MSCTSRKWPEVSPLVHSRCLLRLQNVTRPLDRVAASASRFMYASISTAPLSASCTIGGQQSAALVPIEFVGSDHVRHLDAVRAQLSFEIRNRDFAAVKHARGERGIDPGG